MKGTATTAVGRAVASSTVVRVVRSLMAASRVCAAMAALRGRLRLGRARVIAGLGGGWSGEQERRAAQQLGALAADSRVIAALSSVILAPSRAVHEARTKGLLDSILGPDRPSRIRLGSYAIVVAVLTHAGLLAALGAPTDAVGWSFRAVLVAAGLLVAWRPKGLASAWRDRA